MLDLEETDAQDGSLSAPGDVSDWGVGWGDVRVADCDTQVFASTCDICI